MPTSDATIKQTIRTAEKQRARNYREARDKHDSVCTAFAKAQNVFDELLTRPAVDEAEEVMLNDAAYCAGEARDSALAKLIIADVEFREFCRNR